MPTTNDRDMLKAVISEKKAAKLAAGGAKPDRRPQWRPQSYQGYAPAPALPATTQVAPGFNVDTALAQSYQAYIDKIQSGAGMMPAHLQAEYFTTPTLDQYKSYLGYVDQEQIKRYEYGVDEVVPTVGQQQHWKEIMDWKSAVSEAAKALGVPESEVAETYQKLWQSQNLLVHPWQEGVPSQLYTPQQPVDMLPANQVSSTEVVPASLLDANWQAFDKQIQAVIGWAPDKKAPIHPMNVAAEYGKVAAEGRMDDPAYLILARADDYLKNLSFNVGKEPVDWVWASDSDPYLEQLVAADVLPTTVKGTEQVDIAWMKAMYPMATVPNLTPAGVPYGYEYIQGGLLHPPVMQPIPKTTMFLENLMTTPWAQGALSMLGPALVSGYLKNIPMLLTGGVAGAAAGYFIDKVVPYLNVDNKALDESVGSPLATVIKTLGNGILGYYMLPAVWAEQGIGVAAQGTNYSRFVIPEVINMLEAYVRRDADAVEYSKARLTNLYDAYLRPGMQPGMDTMPEVVVENLRRRWQASVFTYESAASQMQVANIPIGVERMFGLIRGTDPNQLPQFLKPGEKLVFGKAFPQEVGYIDGLTALSYFAHKYSVGRDSLDQMTLEARELFGISAELNDFFLQSILDPQWLMPGFQRFALNKTLGKSNILWAKAIGLAEQVGGGAPTAIRMYIHQLNFDVPPSMLTPGQLRLTNLEMTPEGPVQKKFKITANFTKFGVQLSEGILSPLNWISALRELTPTSKFHWHMQMTYETLPGLINRALMDAGDYVDSTSSVLRQAAYGVDSASATNLGTMVDNLVMHALRQGNVEGYTDFMKRVEVYNKGRANIDMLNQLAKDLNIKNPAELIKDWNGRPGNAETKFEGFKLKWGVDDTVWNSKILGVVFDWVSKNPWTPEQFRDWAVINWMEKVGHYAIEYYGVDKTGKAAQTIWNYLGAAKAAQSLIYLGLNPAFLRRNVYTNISLAFHYDILGGFLGFKFGNILKKYQTDFGRPIYQSGTLAGEIGATRFGGAEDVQGRMMQMVSAAERKITQKVIDVEKGTTRESFSQLTRDFTSAAARKLGIVGHVSSAAETNMHTTAVLVSVKKFMSYLHRPTVGSQAAEVLRATGGDPNRINGLLRGEINDQKFRDILYEGKTDGKPKWEHTLDPIVEKVGIEEGYIRELMTHFGLDEYLNTHLTNNQKKNADVFRTVFKQLEDFIGKVNEEEVVERAAQDEAIATAEGMVSAYSRLVELSYLQHELDVFAHNENSKAAKKAGTDLEAAKTIYAETDYIVNSAYSNFSKRREATWTGLLKAWGFTSKPVLDFVASMMDYHKSFESFFLEKRRMFNAANELQGKEKAAAVRAIQEELFRLYPEWAAKEADNITAAKDLFVQMFKEQMPGVDYTPLVRYFDQVLANAKKRADLVQDMRRFELGVTNRNEYATQEIWDFVQGHLPDEADGMWPGFWIDHYDRAVMEGHKELNDRTGDLTENIETRKPAEAELPVEPGELFPPIDPQYWLDTIQDAQRGISAFDAAHGLAAEALPEAPARSFRSEIVQGLVAAGIAKSTRNAIDILKKLNLPDDVSVAEANRIGEIYRGLRDGGMKASDAAKLAMLEFKSDPLVMGPTVPGNLAAAGATIIPKALMQEQAYRKVLRPVLEEMQKQFATSRPYDMAGDLGRLTPEQRRIWEKEAARLMTELQSNKTLALQGGVDQGNMALLNYNRKTRFDAGIGASFPFIFWNMYTAHNWAVSSFERPGVTATYARLLKLMASHDDENTMVPSRHRGKWMIPARWLPEGMGNSIFYDPLADWMPLNQFVRSWERGSTNLSRLQTDAMGILYDRYKNGEITASEYNAAVNAETRAENPLFQDALRQAQAEGEGNWMDFVEMFSSPNMLLSAPWRMAQGKAPFDQLPVSRTYHSLLGMFGAEPPDVNNSLAHWRRNRSVSEFGDWGIYYVERALANMAALNPDQTAEIIAAMIQHKGKLWEQAEKMVRYEQGIQSGFGMLNAFDAFTRTGLSGVAGAALASFFPGGLLPEGELLQRGLKEEYNQAWTDYNNGNPDAIDNFFDAHPEYYARLALFQEPEERFKQFVTNQIFDMYFSEKTTDLERKAIRDQLGPEFTIGFLNGDTNNLDAFSPEQLANWASAMGAVVPWNMPGGRIDVNPPKLNVPPAQLSQAYEQMKAEQLAVDQNLYAHSAVYNGLPAGERDAYLLSNMPFAAARDKYFSIMETVIIPTIPDFKAIEAGFYDIGSGSLEKLKDENPQLEAGWEYRTQLYTELMDPIGDWRSILDGYMTLPAKSAQRRSYKAQHPEIDTIFDTLDEIDKRIAARYPQFEYLNNLYQELGGDARRVYKEEHPELQQGWDLLDKYKDEWLKIDPDYERHNTEYYDLPPSMRSTYANSVPEWGRALDVERKWIAEYPELDKWINEQEEIEKYKEAEQVMKDIPPEVYPDLIKFYAGVSTLSPGVRAALEYEWEKRGKPYGDFWDWLESMRYVVQQ